MSATPPADPDAAGPESAAPAPRRTRSGAVIVGPTVRARYVPGALIGLPLVAAILSPFAATAVQQWRRARLAGGSDGLLEQVLAPAAVQLLVGALLLWAVFALWALVPMLMTHRAVLLDVERGTLELRRGPRRAARARLEDVEYAVGEAVRGSMALIGLRGVDGGEPRQWVLPEIGWDEASFDGLRALQSAAGLRPAPPRTVLVREERRARRERAHRELAARVGMPWRAEYAQDEAAFQAEFDRVRRVLGGREPARDGDPAPRGGASA
ncbi:hypothetical protein [Brachybacterium sp. YJGR34]|uniref:hypothetical protein n=1 Tax=Brachybacterium sp. YJGR34 TaxID=2059911 RepID=UPI000E0C2E3C|nr:hypothetical protein [Brachybacterium sp. YJGR34]